MTDARNIELAPGVVLKLALIPPGRFTMGSIEGLPLEEPLHEVIIRRAFFLGKFPITQRQWIAVMGSNPSEHLQDDAAPVDSVSWDSSVAFCDAVAQGLGKEYRLPTEAEWEYACRAGSTSEFYFGDEEKALLEYAWFDLNSRGSTHAVGGKRPNPWGLCDMAGNVWEWCADVWHSDYEGAPRDGSAWLDDDAAQPRRVLRGGSWNYDGFRCRSAYRSREWKHFATDHFGFRVALTA